MNHFFKKALCILLVATLCGSWGMCCEAVSTDENRANSSLSLYLPKAIQARDENTTGTEEASQQKQLLQITQTENNGQKYVTSFQYDESGRLSSSSSSSDENVYTYSYDNEGRLRRVDCTYWEPFGAMYAYDYDKNGFLVKISGIGEGGGLDYTLENDENGRPVKKTRKYDFGTAVTEYFYSSDGAHAVEVTTDTHSTGTVYYGKDDPQETTVKTVSVDYTYDDQGRLLSETRTSDGKATCTTYDYSYPPFTFLCDENGTPYRCEITDCVGRRIWDMGIQNDLQSIVCDEDGRLSRIVCKKVTYDFLFGAAAGEAPTQNAAESGGASEWMIAKEHSLRNLKKGTTAVAETEAAHKDEISEYATTVRNGVGYVKNAEHGLNVREEPSTSAKIVRRIANGTRVSITDLITIEGMKWGRVSDGWISMNYVELENEDYSWGVCYIVSPTAGLVNIRCEAGTAYESIERVTSGKVLIIYEIKTVDRQDWGRTDIGWVCMDYLIPLFR